MRAVRNGILIDLCMSVFNDGYRARKQLQSHHDSDDDKIYQLELLVKEATDQAGEAEARYEEVGVAL